MRVLSMIVFLALGLGGCAKNTPAETKSATPPPDPVPNAAAQAPEASRNTENAKPEKASSQSPPPTAAAPTPSAAKSEISKDKAFKFPKTPEARKALERKPGMTPALATHAVERGTKHPDLQGAPGPSPGHGRSDALVNVLVFTDFQCPVCRRAVEPLKAVAREFPNDVRLVFKHNALEMHPRAAAAAAAAIAAFRQGKFWEYHDTLFQNQRALHEQDLLLYAEELELDLGRFKKDMEDPQTKAQIRYERGLATALDARGTPAFFVNGKKTVGWGSYTGFRAGVMRAIGEAKALSAGVAKGVDVSRRATRAGGKAGQRFDELVWGKN